VIVGRALLIPLVAVLLYAPTADAGLKPGCPDARKGYRFYSERIQDWQARHDKEVSAYQARPRGCRAIYRTAVALQRQARAERREYEAWFERTYAKWRCIHRGEGAWNSNTGNGYYGGLQMDVSFYSTYGPEFTRRWGHAGNWPVWAQLLAAERAYASRGFYPWPNTARNCGLL
jgi:hypothetical protein